MVATGVQYRRLPLDGLDRLEGAGVYYAANEIAARWCRDGDAVVIGAAIPPGRRRWIWRGRLNVYMCWSEVKGWRPRCRITSSPGIFAVGDVRAGSVKRVASAVGEGSVVISDVWNHVNARTAA